VTVRADDAETLERSLQRVEALVSEGS